MENNNQSNIFVKTMLFVVLAIILTVGVTYAYFRVNITDLEDSSTISIGGATLKIVYEGTETIKAENVIPGWSAKKYFNVDVTNTSGKDIEYNINLVVTNSNFYTTNDRGNSYLEYALYKCTSNTDTACETELKSASILDIQSGEKLVHSVTTKTSGKTYYALELSFPNQDAVQSQTGTNDLPLTFNGYVTLVSGGEVYATPFEIDSWATIASNIKSGNTSRYKVGETKEVTIGSINYTVRLANNSTPSECATKGFSQTACGFVVEFVDIVQRNQMNSSATNVGGWSATAMRTYLNGDFVSKLPNDLQGVITDTTVVSGHGSTDSNSEREDGNWESTDKIYLLSAREVWKDGISNSVSNYDTAYNTTRQLDYYENLGVTTNNYSNVIKNYKSIASDWWLRTAYFDNSYSFLRVDSLGNWYYISAGLADGGVAPAFRIGQK